jgi:hypothetical protein
MDDRDHQSTQDQPTKKALIRRPRLDKSPGNVPDAKKIKEKKNSTTNDSLLDKNIEKKVMAVQDVKIWNIQYVTGI